MESSDSVVQAGRTFIALLEHQIAEVQSGKSSGECDQRFEEAFNAFGPYGRALLAHLPPSSPSPSPHQGSMLSEEDLDAFEEPGDGHYARLLGLLRESGSTDWEIDAQVIPLPKPQPPLRHAS